MNVFYANCRYENWDACEEHKIFGLKGKRLPDLEKGDLILLRVTSHSGMPYGVKAIWRHESVEPVGSETFVPWEDGDYRWVLHCTALAQFQEPFSEDFATSSKASQKIDSLFAGRIMGSLGALKPIEARSYLDLILEEKAEELRIPVPGGSEEEDVFGFLKIVVDHITNEIGYRAEPAVAGRTQEMKPEAVAQPVIVGERIDLPILNYAPLNEMGVILLFGYYLSDLGFSHLEEIRAGFPDAIGMQRVDAKRYQRVRIEFEFLSRNFVTHGHAVDECDVIVCWEHNWKECPIQVIELKSELFPDQLGD